MTDLFSAERPFAEWKLEGFGQKPALLFPTLSSTHRYSKEHIDELEAGSLIVANSQSNGRGRHERVWLSPKDKNLYFNLLYPLEGIEPHHYSQLMQITAITLASLFRELGIDASVKWPNDILCGKKKVCGMVSELLAKNGRKLLATGIGIDVNADETDLAAIERPVTSLKILLGKSLNREALLRKIVLDLEAALSRVQREGIRPWVDEWRKMDQFIGHSARIVEGDKILNGTILDINEDGSLLFCTESGQIVSRYTGDLEI